MNWEELRKKHKNLLISWKQLREENKYLDEKVLISSTEPVKPVRMEILNKWYEYKKEEEKIFQNINELYKEYYQCSNK